MYRPIAALTLLAFLIPASASAQVLQAYFYSNDAGKESFDKNYEHIDELAPQVYVIDEDFDLRKTRDDGIIRKAEREDVKVVPLVHQEGFSRALMSEILDDEDAQEDIIDALIDEAKDEDYTGWQFDFEYIASADRDEYTEFVERAGKEFRRAKLEFSVAVIPRPYAYAANAPTDLTFAYDYEELAEHADYLVLMAYNDPRSIGPTGSLMYQRQVLTYMTSLVPAKKLSLGVPLFCAKWKVTGGYAEYGLLKHEDVADDVRISKLLFEGYFEGLESEYYAYTVPSGNTYLSWCDGTRGYEAKLDLAREFNLRGVSLWALGQEDEGIWDR
jgi:spore germination protein